MTENTSFSGALNLTRIWGVAALLNAILDHLQVRFSTCTVRGEISGFTRAASGHCYFTLKDEAGQAALRCAMFRRAAQQLNEQPREGWCVEVTGQLDIYAQRGELQFIVDQIQRVGAGTLFEQFLRLKAQLEKEGLFAQERKRVLGAYPRCIGVVTSLAAAALRDVVTTLRRRAPYVQVIIYPCAVQGGEAPEQIIQALENAAKRREVEALLLCRGGGSLEDLWAFNDEQVVRAVAQSPIPIITGIGHETDFTLSDFAADVRAPTPTAAAELVAIAVQDGQKLLAELERRLRWRVDMQLDQAMQHLDRLVLQLGRPQQVLATYRHELELCAQQWAAVSQMWGLRWQQQEQVLQQQLQAALARGMNAAKHQLDYLAARLQGLDPKRVLERGYAWLSDQQGQPVTTVKEVTVGQLIQAQLIDGQLALEVSQQPTGEVN